jgi:hypothetical protein
MRFSDVSAKAAVPAAAQSASAVVVRIILFMGLLPSNRLPPDRCPAGGAS